jgi:CRP-like cAMP-binding protein
MSVLSRQRPLGSCRSDRGCFLCSLPEPSRRRLDGAAVRAEYPARALVLQEGEPAERVIAVCRGSLRLLSYGADGPARVVAVAGAGRLVGAETALLRRPFPYSAETQERTSAWSIHWRALERLAGEDPRLWALIAREMAVDYEQALDLMKRPPFGRLVHLLLSGMAEDAEQPRRRTGAPGEPSPRSLAMTEQEMGELVGLSERSVRRHLARFRQRGLVKRRGASLVVVDDRGLRRLLTG